MKKFSVTLFAFFAFLTIAGATCTVSTECGDRTYPDKTDLYATVEHNVVTVYSDHVVIDKFDCHTNSVHVSCSSGGGNTGGYTGYTGYTGWNGWNNNGAWYRH